MIDILLIFCFTLHSGCVFLISHAGYLINKVLIVFQNQKQIYKFINKSTQILS